MTPTYSDFELYSAGYGGTLDAAAYRVFAPRAKDAIDYLTFGRAAAFWAAENAAGATADDVMRGKLARCECEMVDILHGFAALPVGVVSASNDGYAQSYGGAEEDKLLWRACRKHLSAPVNLMLNGAAG